MHRDGLTADDIQRLAREEFVYFVTLARQDGTPGHWPTFRVELVAALTAAFGLDSRWVDRDEAGETARVGERRRRAFVLVDRVAAEVDPTAAWPTFCAGLWEGRDTLMIEADASRSAADR